VFVAVRTISACLMAFSTAAALWPVAALAHQERPAHFPPGTGSVPTYRTAGPRLLVCGDDPSDLEHRIAGFTAPLATSNRQLFQECQRDGYRNLQEAVDAVRQPGTNILILPGLYQEMPSLAPGPPECANLKAPRSRMGSLILSYEQQRSCPHMQNLVGIFGVRDLQIEGTGAGPGDVVIDAQFQKLNAIRADRSDGIYFRNFTAERTTFNAVYVLETDGFVIDRLVGRWNTEYGFLSFASDHGLFENCEAYGNGDSGVYPGGTSDINRDRGYAVPRYAIEVTGCHSHHNTLGYSGTGGDSVWAHDNVFDQNQGGVSMDSLFPNHPGLPQNHALFEHNVIASNNTNYYPYVRDGTCDKPYSARGIEQGVVCPGPPVPVGVGVIVAGGDYDQFRNNWVYDNWQGGFILLWAPGAVRGDFSLGAQENTSNFNRFTANHLGTDRSGHRLPNGVDFWWDGQGRGNCWDASSSAGSDPIALPSCAGPVSGGGRLLSDPNKLLLVADCSNYSLADRNLPALCGWWDTPAKPGVFAPQLGTVKVIVPGLQLLILLLLAIALFRRSQRGLTQAWLFSGVVAGALLVLGSAQDLRILAVAGAVLLGTWLLALARFQPGLSRGLRLLTLALGITLLAEAIDGGWATIPLLPVGPVWFRLLLEVAWIASMAAMLRGGSARQPFRGAPAAGAAARTSPESP